MKILSAQQIRSADAYTIQHEPIPSVELMERAAIACADWISKNYSVGKKVVVVCGPGNNGGDGLAIARLLSEKWYQVSVIILKSGNYSSDFSENLVRLRSLNIENSECNEQDVVFPFQKEDLIIDAIFGTGLSRPISGWISKWIEAMNESAADIISIDMPSGLFADSHSAGSIIAAKHTLAFQRVRLAFLFPENAKYTGTFHVLPIGLDEQFLEEQISDHYFLEHKAISSILKPRETFSHKGLYGHALLIAGSHGKMGAAVLAANACLHAGSGLLTVHVPACGYEIIQIAVPEAMASVDEEEKSSVHFPNASAYTSIAIGPGLGMDGRTGEELILFLKNNHRPVILDADALNLIAEKKEFADLIPADAILTPHPKEFERLAGKSANDFDRHDRQLQFSKMHSCYVILKGAYSCITTPDGKAYFNSTGNPGMAKGGSGDVLTGILLGLAAQKYSSLETCLLGVYIHGLAGDLAAGDLGQMGMLPTDLIERTGKAFQIVSS